MKEEKILQLLDLLGVKGKASSRWVRSPCPFAPWKHASGKDSHPSFGIEIKPESRYKCLACGSKGSLIWMVMELSDLGLEFPLAEALQLVSSELEDDIVIDAPDAYDEGAPVSSLEPFWPEEYLESFPSWNTSQRAVDYLKTRLPELELANFLNLRYDTGRNRVCFPIRNWQQNLVGMHGRDVTGTSDLRYLAYKYKGQYNQSVWLGESWVDYEKPIILVESVFDLAAILPITHNVLCPLMAAINQAKAYRVQNATELITLFDADGGGDIAREAVSTWLDWIPTTHLSLPKGYKDPGETPQKQLTKLLGPYVD